MTIGELETSLGMTRANIRFWGRDKTPPASPVGFSLWQ